VLSATPRTLVLIMFIMFCLMPNQVAVSSVNMKPMTRYKARARTIMGAAARREDIAVIFTAMIRPTNLERESKRLNARAGLERRSNERLIKEPAQITSHGRGSTRKVNSHDRHVTHQMSDLLWRSTYRNNI
jgi:hypothetical protein